MKRKIKLTTILFFTMCFLNCKEKTYFKEIISERKVNIAMAEFPRDKEDFVINIPLEFNLHFNDFSNIRSVNIYYTLNDTLRSEDDDYLIYNSETNKLLFSLDDFHYPNYPSDIYIIGRKMKISKEIAQKLIEKYNPKKTINDIQSINDTISLVAYKKFRGDNPKIIEELRRIPDSIAFVIRNKEEKKTIHVKARINW